MGTLRKLAAKLPALGLAARVTLLGVAGIILAVLSLQAWEARSRDTEARTALAERLERDLALLEGVIAQLGQGGPWRVLEDGRLARGDFPLDGANAVVDLVSRASGGVATIFKGDERIATSVVRPDGTRAVGTRLAPGPAYDAAVRGGQTYRGVNNILGSDHITIYHPIRDAAGRQLGLLFVGQSLASVEEAAAARRRAAAVAALVVMALSAALLWTVLSRSLRPVRALEAWVRGSAGEGLSAPVPFTQRSDELGALARALEGFRAEALAKRALEAETEEARRLRERRAQAMERYTTEFSTSVGAVMDRFTEASQELLGLAERMSQSAGETEAQATRNAAETEQAAQNLAAVAAAVEQLAATVSEINRQIATANAVTREAVRETRESDARMAALTETAERVGGVIGMIADVAAKTNLLALNATIEAARAGEAGKGFAVVASEVKSLAAQTARATSEVAAQLEAIRRAAEEAAAGMRGIAGTIGRVEEATTTIAAAVEEQGASTREITSRLQGVASATQSVSESMRAVLETARAAQGVSAQVRGAAAGVQEQAHALRAEVDGFLVNTSTRADERRRFERRPAPGHRARVAIGDVVEEMALIDISAGGLALRSDRRVEPGTPVRLTLTTAAGVTVNGRVCRSGEGVLAVVLTNAMQAEGFDRFLDSLPLAA